MIWTLIVVDYDVLYSDGEGIYPTVYAVPQDRQIDAERIIGNSPRIFLESDCECIGDIIEDGLTKEGIPFKMIGEFNIEYEDRQTDYLDDCVTHVII